MLVEIVLIVLASITFLSTTCWSAFWIKAISGNAYLADINFVEVL
jgi:hypothetical protein